MAPFVTEVLGCTCPRCIAFGTPIVAPPDVALAAAPTAAGGGAGGPMTATAGLAPHEFWDRATPPPIEGFIEGQVVADTVLTVVPTMGTPQTVVPPMGTQPGTVTIPPRPVEPVEPTPTVTYPVVPVAEPPREVQIVPVGTPLADVVGLPGNPFLD